jgi:hypothetical protein
MKLEPEMIYRETVDGPWGPTTGSPLVAQFDTGAPQYRWLTQSLFVGEGLPPRPVVGEGRLAGPRTIEYQIYRVD